MRSFRSKRPPARRRSWSARSTSASSFSACRRDQDLIATLKARLSEYLDAVKAGEEILVTDRGRPVARLTPIGGRARAETRTAELVRTGTVRPPSAPLG